MNQALQRMIRSAERNRLEATLLLQIRAVGLPLPVQQHRFCERKWAFDFAWPAVKVACEVQGGTFSAGAHVRGAGYQRDCEKAQRAVVLGWRLIPVTSADVTSGKALTVIEAALAQFSPPAGNAHSDAVMTVEPPLAPETALEPSSRG